MIELPFPPASLSGHNTGHWRAKSPVVAKHREWARLATLAAGCVAPADGDIRVVVGFFPPNRRGDRINFPNRMKPYFDGIADALGVNDSRFLPSYVFGEPEGGGRVTVNIDDATPFAVSDHLRQVQVLINRCTSPATRKELIITAHCCGALDKADTELLIQANMLETA